MPQIITTGASGPGFITEAAGPLLLLVLAAALFAVPLVRNGFGSISEDLRKHFAGPSPSAEATDGTASGTTEDTPAETTTGRASDRDEWSDFFDLNVLTLGDAPDVTHDDPAR